MLKLTQLSWLLACTLCLGVGTATAQDSAEQAASVDDYRAMTYGDRDANPALLVVDRGEELFKQKRGPKQVSLETCDFGLGAGVVKGAYAQLPRYFKDTDRVQDLESRLLTCMTTLQGFDAAELTKKTFADERINEPNMDIEAIAAYVAVQSDGMKLNAPSDHPKEKEAIAMGEQLFWHRHGPLDFSCATCHSADGKRIRLQELGSAYTPKNVQKTMGSWPTYRVSHGLVRNMQHRMWDCHWQMRLPDLEFGSPMSTALLAFLSHQGKDAPMVLPGMTR